MNQCIRGLGVRRLDNHRVAAGFTLIELLVVIAIIGVLIALTFLVGSTVVSGSKRSATLDVLRSLDSALTTYEAANGRAEPVVADPRDASGNTLMPIIDGRDMTASSATSVPPGNQMIDSTALFIVQTGKVPAARAIIDKIPSRFMQTRDADQAAASQGELTTVLDAWQRPIRYVHPAFDGAITNEATHQGPTAVNVIDIIGSPTVGQTLGIPRVRRNSAVVGVNASIVATWTQAQQFPDSDGGTGVGNRPYFYSAGEDGLVGVILDSSGNLVADFNKDNVYLIPPKFPKSHISSN